LDVATILSALLILQRKFKTYLLVENPHCQKRLWTRGGSRGEKEREKLEGKK
jgi:hypothetical protein